MFYMHLKLFVMMRSLGVFQACERLLGKPGASMYGLPDRPQGECSWKPLSNLRRTEPNAFQKAC